jgi:hypothetical protein
LRQLQRKACRLSAKLTVLLAVGHVADGTDLCAQIRLIERIPEVRRATRNTLSAERHGGVRG